MDAAAAAALVRDLGFPVAVAGFVLWRVDRSIRDLTATITSLRLLIAYQLQPWDGCERRRRRDPDAGDCPEHP
jgi:hypothetical protein